MKSEIVHARISSDIKEKSESILNDVGFTISQAIDLFLRQVILKKGIPFKLDNIEKNTYSDIAELSFIINSTDGAELTLQQKKIINLYARGDIDLDTAKYAILKG